jgi:hypothetical protein
METDPMMFSALVRVVAQEARAMGLVVPGFRSPPRLAGAVRTIRAGSGAPIIAVRLRGRPFADVAADVVEGVLVANGVPAGADLRVRRRLLTAVEPVTPRAA